MEELRAAAEEKEVRLDLAEAVDPVGRVAAVEDRDEPEPREDAGEVVGTLEEVDAPAHRRKEDDGAARSLDALDHARKLRTVLFERREAPDRGRRRSRALGGRRVPLLFVSPFVLGVEREVLVAAHPAERAHLPVMHERVARAPHGSARLADAAVVVVVLEEADAEALVERPDLLPGPPRHGRAEEREHRDVEGFAVVLADPVPGPGGQLADVRVRHRHLRRVGDGIGHGADEAEVRVGREVAREGRRPAARHDRVVVQDDEHVPRGGGEAGVGRGGESPVLRLEERPDPGVPPGAVLEKLPRAVGRAVVHDEDLEVRPLGSGREAVETEPVELPPVPGDDDDRDLRKRRGDGGVVAEPVRPRPGALGREAPRQVRPGGIRVHDQRGAERSVAAQAIQRVERLGRRRVGGAQRHREHPGGDLPDLGGNALRAERRFDRPDAVAGDGELASAGIERGRAGKKDDLAAVLRRRRRRGGRLGGGIRTDPVHLRRAQDGLDLPAGRTRKPRRGAACPPVEVHGLPEPRRLDAVELLPGLHALALEQQRLATVRVRGRIESGREVRALAPKGRFDALGRRQPRVQIGQAQVAGPAVGAEDLGLGGKLVGAL